MASQRESGEHAPESLCRSGHETRSPIARSRSPGALVAGRRVGPRPTARVTARRRRRLHQRATVFAVPARCARAHETRHRRRVRLPRRMDHHERGVRDVRIADGGGPSRTTLARESPRRHDRDRGISQRAPRSISIPRREPRHHHPERLRSGRFSRRAPEAAERSLRSRLRRHRLSADERARLPCGTQAVSRPRPGARAFARDAFRGTHRGDRRHRTSTAARRSACDASATSSTAAPSRSSRRATPRCACSTTSRALRASIPRKSSKSCTLRVPASRSHRKARFRISCGIAELERSSRRATRSRSPRHSNAGCVDFEATRTRSSDGPDRRGTLRSTRAGARIRTCVAHRAFPRTQHGGRR